MIPHTHAQKQPRRVLPAALCALVAAVGAPALRAVPASAEGSFGGPGEGAGQFVEPQGIAVLSFAFAFDGLLTTASPPHAPAWSHWWCFPSTLHAAPHGAAGAGRLAATLPTAASALLPHWPTCCRSSSPWRRSPICDARTRVTNARNSPRTHWPQLSRKQARQRRTRVRNRASLCVSEVYTSNPIN
jgi:hypothetical protein